VPHELIATAPRTTAFREYEVSDPEPHQATVRTKLSTISHGTEMSLYRGTAPFATQEFDLERRAFIEHEGGTIFPCRLGTEYVGEVTAIGEKVENLAVGDLVYGRGGHRDVQQGDAASLVRLSSAMDCEAALFVHQGCVALNAVHDGDVRVGDTVAVFGLGVIGLLAVQIALLSGASRVFAVESIARRQEVGREFGAECVFDPSVVDAGLEIKSRVGAGVDVAVELSGTYPGLQSAIRSVCKTGRVVGAGYYQGGGNALRLGEEFLHNRVDVVSSMYVWDCPHRAFPRWTRERLQETVFELLSAGRLSTQSLVTHRVTWQNAADAYQLLDERGNETIRVAVTYE
jgi:2-desacetyl-2-hydroxyethyl bacteriochlorophyllide A dehydrogenase